MDFDYSPRQREWIKRVSDFMEHYVYPAEETYAKQMTSRPCLRHRDFGKDIERPIGDYLNRSTRDVFDALENLVGDG